jgi:hypothetical protein
MELPYDVVKLIKEYSMPLSRPDWRLGCYLNRHIYTYFNFTDMIKLLAEDFSNIEDYDDFDDTEEYDNFDYGYI